MEPTVTLIMEANRCADLQGMFGALPFGPVETRVFSEHERHLLFKGRRRLSGNST